MADEDPWGDVGEEDSAATTAASPAKSGSKPASKTATPATGSKAPTPATGSKAGTPLAGSKAGSQEPGTPSHEKSGSLGRTPIPVPQEEKRPIRYYRHWVRPKFLQYKYMYQYRHNYYNDVIDYLEKKDKGINRALPQPQTWAERVLRTNAERKYDYFDKPASVVANPRYWGPYSGRISPTAEYHPKEESHLIITLPAVIKATNYHTKSYINQRYQKVL